MGLKRKRGTEKREKRARPLTRELLLKIRRRLAGKGTARARRDMALITLGFVAALRRSELVKLRWSDVVFQANAVRLRLRKPKWRTGDAHVTIAATNASGVDAVSMLRALRAESGGGPEQTVFRTLRGRHEGGALSAWNVGSILLEAVRDAGENPAGFFAALTKAGRDQHDPRPLQG